MSSDLAIHTTVAELCSVFQQAEIDVRRAAQIVADVEASLDAAFLIAGRGARNIVTLRIAADHRRHGYTTENIDKVIHEMRRRAWRAIVERLELRRMMSIKRWESLDEQLDKDEWPELTEANVAAFAKQFVASLDEMLDGAIDEVFNWLRPHALTGGSMTPAELQRRARDLSAARDELLSACAGLEPYHIRMLAAVARTQPRVSAETQRRGREEVTNVC